MSVKIASEVYADYVQKNSCNKAVYTKMVKAFRADIEEIGFKINEYEPFEANRMVNNKQHNRPK